MAAKEKIAIPLSSASVESYQQSYPHLVRVSALHEVLQINSVLPLLSSCEDHTQIKNFETAIDDLAEEWERRWKEVQPLFQTGEELLSVRIGLLTALKSAVEHRQSSKSVFSARIGRNSFLSPVHLKLSRMVKKCWVRIGRLARRQGLFAASAHSLGTALLVSGESKTEEDKLLHSQLLVEKIKLLKGRGEQQYLVLQKLDEFLNRGEEERGGVEGVFVRAKGFLLKGKCMEETGDATMDGNSTFFCLSFSFSFSFHFSRCHCHLSGCNQGKERWRGRLLPSGSVLPQNHSSILLFFAPHHPLTYAHINRPQAQERTKKTFPPTWSKEPPFESFISKKSAIRQTISPLPSKTMAFRLSLGKSTSSNPSLVSSLSGLAMIWG